MSFRIYPFVYNATSSTESYTRSYTLSLHAPLPIGGHFTMGPREAALAVELLGVKHVLPIHYGTFPALAGTPDQLRSELASRGLSDVTVHAVEPGGSLS
jgi:L-ascorbate metabolism protein UlaG (beta-lactamase superfamily)